MAFDRDNNEEGCASPTATNLEVTARGENNMSAACGGNCMPKILDAVDEIRAAKCNFEEMLIAHLLYLPTR
jgi:hypothetical protein